MLPSSSPQVGTWGGGGLLTEMTQGLLKAPSNLFPSTAAIFKVDIFSTVMGMLLKAALSNGSFVLESGESEN